MRPDWFVLAIVVGLPAVSVVWWWWADRLLRRSRAGWASWGRWVLAGFMVVQLVVLVSRNVAWLSGGHVDWPTWLLAPHHTWALLLTPMVLAPMLGVAGVWWVLRGGWGWVRGRGREERPDASAAPQRRLREVDPGRRRLMSGVAAAAVGGPMVATVGMSGVALAQRATFRVRRITAAVPGLPERLSGMTIAHISDVHVGEYTHGRVLHRIAEAVNAMAVDLVVVTGDLINHRLDELPEALAMLDRIDPRSGLLLCEGNHDVMHGIKAGFIAGVQGAGHDLLLDDARTVRVRGEPVQVLGTQWHTMGLTPAQHLELTMRHRDPDAFPILIGHHPDHMFEDGAEYGLPLTLAGHTHGGLINLSDEIGFGPRMFRYWSGLYRDAAGRSLVVSNGVGDWFPLRVRAPAELVHVTVVRG